MGSSAPVWWSWRRSTATQLDDHWPHLPVFVAANEFVALDRLKADTSSANVSSTTMTAPAAAAAAVVVVVVVVFKVVEMFDDSRSV